VSCLISHKIKTTQKYLIHSLIRLLIASLILIKFDIFGEVDKIKSQREMTTTKLLRLLLKLLSQSWLILIPKIKTNKNKQKYFTDNYYQ